jgi:hypothetical protein
MKKNLSLLSATVALSLAAALQASAQAPTPIPSPDPDYQSVAESTTLLHNGDSINGTFDITSAGSPSSITIGSEWSAAEGLSSPGNLTYSDEIGFNAGTQQVTSGTVNFWIEDSIGKMSSYSLDLGGTTTSGVFNVGGSGSKVVYNFTDGNLDSGQIALLNNDGQLSYTITDTGAGGDSAFTVDYSVLQVDTSPIALGGIPAPAVPEPSTYIAGALLLLPFGFSFLRALRKNRTA